MKTFRLPDLGEGLQEAQIVQWHAGEGADVAADAPLLSVETDKAVTEVPAPWSGRIVRLCAKVGDVVKVGSVVVEFEGSGQEHAPPHHPTPAPPASALASAAPGPAGNAMPAVRLLARELGLDMAAIKGTGPGGAVLVRDLANVLKRSGAGSPQAPPPFTGLSGTRRSMAQNMTRSGREVVPATVHEEADLGAWTNRAGLTARLVRAIVKAMAAEPVLNSSGDETTGLRANDALHLGIAVDGPDGLLVPVLLNANAQAPERLGAELARLFDAARARRLGPDELRGATFTLSNYGMIGGLHATPVVVPPQVAILGAGRLADRVVARDGVAVIRPILPLSLTFDHRFITGGEASRFARALIADLEMPD